MVSSCPLGGSQKTKKAARVLSVLLLMVPIARMRKSTPTAEKHQANVRVAEEKLADAKRAKAHTNARKQSSRERESRAQDLENNIEQEAAIEKTQGSRARVPSPVRTGYTNETRLKSTPLQPNQNRIAMGSTWAIDALHIGKGRKKFIRRPVAPERTHRDLRTCPAYRKRNPKRKPPETTT